MESVRNAFGNAVSQRPLTSGLKMAAVLEMATRLAAWYGCPVAAWRSNSSISGRAIASPVMNSSWTPSRSVTSQVLAGSNLGSRSVRCPANRCMSRPVWAPPCMSGLSGKVTSLPSWRACPAWSYSVSRWPV